LVIMRTAFRFGGRYEWAQHIELSEAQGITPAELAALGADAAPDPAAWAPLELAALRAVDETAAEGSVADATWVVLVDLLDDAAVIELLMLIAHYEMLTGV